MSEASSCKNCVMCVPNEFVYTKSEFLFPDDTECGMGDELYPECGYLCPNYQYQDNGYIEVLPIWPENF